MINLNSFFDGVTEGIRLRSCAYSWSGGEFTAEAAEKLAAEAAEKLAAGKPAEKLAEMIKEEIVTYVGTWKKESIEIEIDNSNDEFVTFMNEIVDGLDEIVDGLDELYFRLVITPY